jgi:hypothetical protein
VEALRDVFGRHSVQAVGVEGEEMRVLKYRLLREGERVKKGDEYRSPQNERGVRGKWKPVESADLGIDVADPLFFAARQFRRLVK